MLVISGGVRTDTGWRYQVHQIDLHQFMKGLTKATFRIDRHEDIASTIFRAYDIATSDEPGSVFLERVKRVQRSCRRLAMESSGRVNLPPWPRVPRCPQRAIRDAAFRSPAADANPEARAGAFASALSFRPGSDRETTILWPW
jgi:thiamine pyrophosphate-dependent acetolactate synthase large subunit-like protein